VCITLQRAFANRTVAMDLEPLSLLSRLAARVQTRAIPRFVMPACSRLRASCADDGAFLTTVAIRCGADGLVPKTPRPYSKVCDLREVGGSGLHMLFYRALLVVFLLATCASSAAALALGAGCGSDIGIAPVDVA
jgi:hypothetical protein